MEKEKRNLYLVNTADVENRYIIAKDMEDVIKKFRKQENKLSSFNKLSGIHISLLEKDIDRC